MNQLCLHPFLWSHYTVVYFAVVVAAAFYFLFLSPLYFSLRRIRATRVILLFGRNGCGSLTAEEIFYCVKGGLMANVSTHTHTHILRLHGTEATSKHKCIYPEQSGNMEKGKVLRVLRKSMCACRNRKININNNRKSLSPIDFLLLIRCYVIDCQKELCMHVRFSAFMRRPIITSVKYILFLHSLYFCA